MAPYKTRPKKQLDQFATLSGIPFTEDKTALRDAFVAKLVDETDMTNPTVIFREMMGAPPDGKIANEHEPTEDFWRYIDTSITETVNQVSLWNNKSSVRPEAS